MHTLTFYPLGNADCCRVDLNCGEKLLFDYANMRCVDDPDDLRIDLPCELREDLNAAKRDYYDVVAFSHLDNDHICGAPEFFHLEHAKKYQGEGRIKIKTLWVPAAVIIEQGCEDDAKIVQAEARHRLIEGKGIRVFSRPDELRDWLKEQGLTLGSRQHLMTDAGQLAPEFNLTNHGVEFFVHSPFASRLDDGTLIDRNIDSLVLQATFQVDTQQTKLMLTSDVDHSVLTEMVNITKKKKREYRLEWDIFKLPHHCSYLSLGPEKGKDKTIPVPEVKWLLENQGQYGGTVVSPSYPIPTNDDDDQPPHRQAANYHREYTKAKVGEFKVTMEHPKPSAPEPLVIEIGRTKARIKKPYLAGAASVVSQASPRVG